MTHPLFLSVICVQVLSLLQVALGQSCSFQDELGDYKVSWRYDPSSRLVDFTLEAKQMPNEPDFWTGLGVGDKMLDADFTIIMVANGDLRFSDMFLKTDTYKRPYTDSIDNLRGTSGQLINGRVYANFSRPVDSGDPQDKSLRDCVTFQFPVGGGRISRGKMQMHNRTPIRKSAVCDILTSCTKSAPLQFINNQGPINSHAQFNSKNQNGNLNPPGLGNSQSFNSPHFGANGGSQGNPRIVQNGQAFQPGHNIRPFTPPRLPSSEVSSGRIKPAVKLPETPASRDVPPGCQFHADGYSVIWVFNPATRNVEYSLSVREQTRNFWTGIGFGKQMSQADFVVVTSIDGRVEVTDRYSNPANGGHSEPKIDFRDNVKYLGSGSFNGMLNVTFAKPIDGEDPEDFPAEDPNLRQPGVKAGCQYFQFPVGGGRAKTGGSIDYHSVTPMRRLVCGVSHCLPGGTGSKISEVAFSTEPSPKKILAPEREERLDHQPKQDIQNDCPENDHPLCDLYFDDYFHKIREWSDENAYNPENEIPKACSLVRDLQGGLVTRACCRSFKIRCAQIEEFTES